MKRMTSILCAAAMAISTVGFTSMQASAQPGPFVPLEVAPAAEVIQVRSHRARDYRPSARHFERRGNRAYYRGHRGYRHARPGWRQYDGWWFPPAAFALGAIFGGALAQPPVVHVPRQRVMTQAHVDWCFARYRSYRVSDNTFQPYHGPRRQCVSPHWG